MRAERVRQEGKKSVAVMVSRSGTKRSLPMGPPEKYPEYLPELYLEG